MLDLLQMMADFYVNHYISLLVVSFMIYLTFIHSDISHKTYSVWSMIITLYYQAKIPIGRQNTLLVELIEIHTPLI